MRLSKCFLLIVGLVATLNANAQADLLHVPSHDVSRGVDHCS